MDDGEAEDRDEVGDDDYNHTSHSDRHSVVGNSRKHLTADHDINDGETRVDNHIEHRAKFCPPKTK